MLDSRVRRLLEAYPTIFLACHRQHLRNDGEGNALSENQASVLHHLDQTRPSTLSRLAEHMGISRSTMSLTVSRLVNSGYIHRHRSSGDARSIALTLTARGARACEDNSVLNTDLIGELFQSMSSKEAERALQGLECLAKYASILLRRRKRERDL